MAQPTSDSGAALRQGFIVGGHLREDPEDAACGILAPRPVSRGGLPKDVEVWIPKELCTKLPQLRKAGLKGHKQSGVHFFWAVKESGGEGPGQGRFVARAPAEVADIFRALISKFKDGLMPLAFIEMLLARWHKSAKKSIKDAGGVQNFCQQCPVVELVRSAEGSESVRARAAPEGALGEDFSTAIDLAGHFAELFEDKSVTMASKQRLLEALLDESRCAQCADIERCMERDWMSSGDREHKKLLGALLMAGASPNYTGGVFEASALMRACAVGRVDVVQMLLEAQGDVAARGAMGWTALHLAVAGAEEGSAGGEGRGEDRLEVVRLLISRAEPGLVNACVDEGGMAMAPLSLALWSGRVDIAQLLLDSGADWAGRDAKGRTALHYAFWCPDDSVPRRAQDLMTKGGGYIDPGGEGTVAFGTGARSEERFQSMFLGLTAGRELDLNAQDDDKNAALHIACTRGWSTVVESLVKSKADANLRRGDGSAPLHIMCNDEGAALTEHERGDIIRVLMREGRAEPFLKDGKGKYPREGSLAGASAGLKKVLKREAERKKKREAKEMKDQPVQPPAVPDSWEEADAAEGGGEEEQEAQEESPPEDTMEERIRKLIDAFDVKASLHPRGPRAADEEGDSQKQPAPVKAFLPGEKEGTATQGGEGAAASGECGEQASAPLEPRKDGEELGQEAAEAVDDEEEDEAVVPLESFQLRDLPWDVRFTREFKEQFVALNTQPALQKAVFEKITRLANGEQGGNLMKQLRGTPKSLTIYESPCKTWRNSGRFLWQYCVDYSPRVQTFTEVIRLWKIVLRHDDVPHAMQYIIDSHKRGRRSTVKRQLRSLTLGSCLQDDKRFPRRYEECADAGQVVHLLEQEALGFLAAQDGLEEEAADARVDLIVYTPPAVTSADSYNVLKFYELNDDVVRSLMSWLLGPVEQQGGGASHEFPFIPDVNEDKLIHKNITQRSSSVLLVGRSGTGKTSIAVARMWALYNAWKQHEEAAGEDAEPYHQVFVTANSVLRDQVRKSFRGIQGGRADGRADATPNTLRHDEDITFPLFLTQKEWILAIDGTLDEPFFPREKDGSLKYPLEGGFQEIGALEAMPDDDDWYSEDEDEDEVEDEEVQVEELQNDERGEGGGEGRQGRQRMEIDFAVFQARVWPRIAAANKAATKQLSPSSLFQEIHSFIKGSNLALSREGGKLSREDYLKLPAKMAPNFQGLSANETVADLPGDRRGNKDLVYDLFEAYEAEKRALQAYDISDVIHHMYTQLLAKPYEGKKIHSIFVDETQDFTQAELRLFLHVCADKNDLFFSGDTAQTIASGVSFRFEDLRSLFKEEQDRCMEVSTHTHLPPVQIPDVTTLDVNYRTHNGILQTASAVIDLLKYFFPGSFDTLPRESGFFDGPRPITLLETSVEEAAVLIVGSDKKASQIEFGAHQVILVRNQEAKALLPEDFEGCLAMTVTESKGLEFDDVFLWNFFSESRADQEWRLVLTYLLDTCGDEGAQNELSKEREESKDKDVQGMLRRLPFSKHAHQILCEELKHLYTAITRARVRLIIYEQDSAKRAPMFHFLKTKGLVETLSLNLGDASKPGMTGMTKTNSKEEWRKQGENLRSNGLIKLAIKCFKKSGDDDLLAEAQAQDIVTHPKNLTKDDYMTAGELFLRGCKGINAAHCFKAAGRKDLAGHLFMMHAVKMDDADQRKDKIGIEARNCFRATGEHAKIRELYHSMGKTRLFLQECKAKGKYYEAIEFLDEDGGNYKPKEDLSLAEFLSQAAMQVHSSKTISEEKRAEFLRLVKRMPDQRQIHFYRSYGYREQLTAKLKELNMHCEAADELVQDGMLEAACAMMDQLKDGAGEKELEYAAELRLRHAISVNQWSAEDEMSHAIRAQQRIIDFLERSGSKTACNPQQLRLLHLRLEVCLREGRLRSAQKGNAQRAEALRAFVQTCEELTQQGCDCKLPEAIARHQLLAGEDLEALVKAKGVLSLLIDVERNLRDSIKAGIPTPACLPYEHFFGIKRLNGQQNTSMGSKTLIERMGIRIGRGVTFGQGRDEVVLVQPEHFRESLFELVDALILDTLTKFHTAAAHLRDFPAAHGAEMEPLRAGMLAVWAAETGKVRCRKDAKDVSAARLGLPALSLRYRGFAAKHVDQAVGAVTPFLVPSITRGAPTMPPAWFLSAGGGGAQAGEWSSEILQAKRVASMYAQRQQTALCDAQKDAGKGGRPKKRVSAQAVSTVLGLFFALGEPKEAGRLLLMLSRADPAYSLELQALELAWKDDGVRKASLKVQFLLQAGPSVPINAWEVLEQVCGEAAVALSCTPGAGSEWSAAGRVFVSTPCYLAAGSAQRFNGASRRVRKEGEPEVALYRALDAAAQVLRVSADECRQAHADPAPVRRRVAAMAWPVVATFLAALARARDEPASAWRAEWGADLHRLVARLGLRPGAPGEPATDTAVAMIEGEPAVAVLPSAAAPPGLQCVRAARLDGGAVALEVLPMDAAEADALVVEGARLCREHFASASASAGALQRRAQPEPEPLISRLNPAAVEFRPAAATAPDAEAAAAAAEQLEQMRRLERELEAQGEAARAITRLFRRVAGRALLRRMRERRQRELDAAALAEHGGETWMERLGAALAGRQQVALPDIFGRQRRLTMYADVALPMQKPCVVNQETGLVLASAMHNPWHVKEALLSFSGHYLAFVCPRLVLCDNVAHMLTSRLQADCPPDVRVQAVMRLQNLMQAQAGVLFAVDTIENALFLPVSHAQSYEMGLLTNAMRALEAWLLQACALLHDLESAAPPQPGAVQSPQPPAQPSAAQGGSAPGGAWGRQPPAPTGDAPPAGLGVGVGGVQSQVEELDFRRAAAAPLGDEEKDEPGEWRPDEAQSTSRKRTKRFGGPRGQGRAGRGGAGQAGSGAGRGRNPGAEGVRDGAAQQDGGGVPLTGGWGTVQRKGGARRTAASQV